MMKYAHIDVHSPIVMEGAWGYSAIMYYMVEVFQQTYTYYDMLIYMLWSYYKGIDQFVWKKVLHVDVQLFGRTDGQKRH